MLAESISETLGYGTRIMELSLPQRADPVFASETEKKEAVSLSEFAVKEILAGKSGYMRFPILTKLKKPSRVS